MAYRSHTVTVGTSTVDCVSFGRGRRALVILPGLSVRDVKGAGMALALMYRAFGKHYRVYVFDKPRHIAEGCTIADIARTTAGAMRALDIEGIDCAVHIYTGLGHAAYEEAGDFNRMVLSFFES